jgi:NAD(P)-dependent dehydrogenase (short-subunit alcohol dehydrogenase family)
MNTGALRKRPSSPPTPIALAERPTCLVTGGSAGIGRAIARGLAERGARVWVLCRDRARGLEAMHEIAWRTGSDVDLVLADLSDMRSVLGATQEICERVGKIDVLVNNAAVWSVERVETAQGVERTWAVNVLAYYLLTSTLAPQLAKNARVVNVASGLAHSLDLDDVEFRTRRYKGVNAYAQSKQADRMLTRAFARKLRGATVNSMHPGFTRTTAFAKGGGVQGFVAGIGARLFGKPPSWAADTAVWLALDREIEGVSGGYFEDRIERACPFTDEAQEDELFALCERMCEELT